MNLSLRTPLHLPFNGRPPRPGFRAGALCPSGPQKSCVRRSNISSIRRDRLSLSPTDRHGTNVLMEHLQCEFALCLWQETCRGLVLAQSSLLPCEGTRKRPLIPIFAIPENGDFFPMLRRGVATFAQMFMSLGYPMISRLCPIGALRLPLRQTQGTLRTSGKVPYCG